MTHIHYFLGVGQHRNCQRWLKRNAGIADITFYEAFNYLRYDSRSKMYEAAETYMKNILVHAKDGDVIFAESQAAPTLAHVLAGVSLKPSNVVLMTPLGLNPTALGTTERQRYKELFRRSGIFWRGTNQRMTLYGNRATFFNLFLSSLSNIRRLRSAYMIGANQDIRTSVIKLARRYEVIVAAATDDELFPYDEIRTEIGSSDIRMVRLQGGHMNRATPNGIKQLTSILATLKQ